ncbi:MAG: SidE phosphodiesterase domain-containing protein [Legionellaceae bacterium]|nr:SidE phosphodiesterase domain-containing protein [Legionellaceae bacterium]
MPPADVLLPEIQAMLAKKGLSPTLFVTSEIKKLDADLSPHVAWVHENIYKHAYSNGNSRELHGTKHVTRVAKYISVFANLYKKHGDKQAENLSNEDLHLLQIAALFHDGAREDDGVDQWDHESALLLYCYLTRVLKVDKEKAKLIAEATANKDAKQNQDYFEIHENEQQGLSWGFTLPIVSHEKNIYQKLIHDADCLDIIRVRDQYDATYLDFYQDIVSQPPEITLALEEMAHLIMEARSLIAIQGDDYQESKLPARKTYRNDIKQMYQENTYALTQKDIETNKLRILSTLGNGLLAKEVLQRTALVDLTSYDTQQGFSHANVLAALREGKVLLRGVPHPWSLTDKHQETFAHLELYKIFRAPQIPTRTEKENRLEKEGNPHRSFSMMGYGACSEFARVGFLQIAPEISKIIHVSEKNICSGRGKKNGTNTLRYREQRLSDKDLQEKLSELNHQLKLGGKTNCHSEILCDAHRYDAIYYTLDPHSQENKSLKEQHTLFALLDVRLLRSEYEQHYGLTRNAFIKEFGGESGIRYFQARFGDTPCLPVFQYSGIHNTMEPVSEQMLSDKNIVAIWSELCSDFMRQYIRENQDLQALSIDEIKIRTLQSFCIKNDGLSNHSQMIVDMLRPHPSMMAFHQKLNQHIWENKEQHIKRSTEAFICNFNENSTSSSNNALHGAVFERLLMQPNILPQIKARVIEDFRSRDWKYIFFNEEYNFIYYRKEHVSIPYFTSEDIHKASTLDGLNAIVKTKKIDCSPALKAYVLCCQLEKGSEISLEEQTVLLQCKEVIKKQTIIYIESLFKKIEEQILVFTRKNSGLYDESNIKLIVTWIINIDLYLKIFQLNTSAALMSKFEKVIQAFLQSFDGSVPGHFKRYLKAVEELAAAHLLTDIHKQGIQIRYNNYVGVTESQLSLGDLIQLGRLLQGPVCVSEIIEWMKKNNQYPLSMENLCSIAPKLAPCDTPDDSKLLALLIDTMDPEDLYAYAMINPHFFYIVKHIPLNDNNLLLFTALINKIGATARPLADSRFALVFSEKEVENHKFSAKQRNIIEQRWVKLCDEYVTQNEAYVLFGRASTLMQSLDALVSMTYESTLLPPSATLIRLFHRKLDEWVRVLQSRILDGLSPEELAQVNQILKVHDKLGFAQERQASITILREQQLKQQVTLPSPPSSLR